MHKKLIALDFDGVLHAYTSPWTDAATISDGPTEGAMQFLRDLVEDGRFEVCVVSSRLSHEDGGHKVYTWIRNELEKEFGGAAFQVYNAIRFEKTRPPAFLTIDDRSVTFEGTWPDLDAMAAFKPWNKRPSLVVLGTPTPGDDLMIAAIAQGMATGEADRTAPALAEPTISLETARLIARRAFSAGVGRHGYCEYDCRFEVEEIIERVLADEEEDRRFLEGSGVAA